MSEDTDIESRIERIEKKLSQIISLLQPEKEEKKKAVGVKIDSGMKIHIDRLVKKYLWQQR